VRVAIISDTHMPRGARALPAACVRQLEEADAILHAGDFMTSQVLADLRTIGPPVHAVHGNVDATDLKRMLPERTTVELDGARIALVHDPGPKHNRIQRLKAKFPDAHAVVFGHTHMPEHQRTEDGFQIFNPGSPTERRRAPRHTMGVAIVHDGRVEFRLVELS
jgi:putative phosphoesterase